MKRVAADLEQRTNGNGEQARKRISEAARLDRESGEPNPGDSLAATAECLVRIATKAFMQMRNVDYETAQQWIAGAAVHETKNRPPAPKSRKTRS